MPEDNNYAELGENKWIRFSPDGRCNIGGGFEMVGMNPDVQRKLLKVLQERFPSTGKYAVAIRWGCSREVDPSEYEFSTLAEKDAFMQGVDASSGWMDYEIVG